MAADEPPAVARHRLRRALRRAREDRGLTQRQVAESLEWSLSKVNRIEAGDVTISSTDLQALLRLYEITDPDLVAELLAEARAARQRGWWDRPEYRDHLTSAMIQSIQFEAEATEIRSFQPTVIPGVLQTRAYAAAVIGAWGRLPEADRASRLEVRARRRDALFSRPEPPEYLLLLDESVMLREVGGPAAMSEQLYDLVALGRAGRIRVRVAPLAHTIPYFIGLFIIYARDSEDIALYRESALGDEIVYSSDVILPHRDLFDRIWDTTLTEEASIDMVEARAATLRAAAHLKPDG